MPERAPLDLRQLAADSCAVLKDEPGARVVLLGRPPDAVVAKTYRNSGLRLLQTLLRRSRAEREHRNLARVAATGIACTPPREWHAVRRGGCVVESTLVTDFVAGARTLKDLLGDRAATGAATRRALAIALGRLLARLHECGVLWCTAMPRNVLVVGSAPPQLVVSDAPAAVFWRRAVPDRGALIDLHDAVMSASRRRDWSPTERFRCLCSYADGDRARARRLWRTLARRTLPGHRLRKNLMMALRTYILPGPEPVFRSASAR